MQDFRDEILTRTDGADHPADEVPQQREHGGKSYRNGLLANRIYKIDTLRYTLYHETRLSMKSQMVKWGNSLAVRIPKAVVQKARLKEGDSLEVEAAAEGHVELRRPAKVPTLAQLVSQITAENRYSEISTGAEVAKEVVEW